MIFEYVACVGETGKGFVEAKGGYHFEGGGIECIPFFGEGGIDERRDWNVCPSGIIIIGRVE
eukprot:scaffold145937_cov36-Cyclotella_meneghiniana.AAC.1